MSGYTTKEFQAHKINWQLEGFILPSIGSCSSSTESIDGLVHVTFRSGGPHLNLFNEWNFISSVALYLHKAQIQLYPFYQTVNAI
jgi:hypothetical protein